MTHLKITCFRRMTLLTFCTAVFSRWQLSFEIGRCGQKSGGNEQGWVFGDSPEPVRTGTFSEKMGSGKWWQSNWNAIRSICRKNFAMTRAELAGCGTFSTRAKTSLAVAESRAQGAAHWARSMQSGNGLEMKRKRSHRTGLISQCLCVSVSLSLSLSFLLSFCECVCIPRCR